MSDGIRVTLDNFARESDGCSPTSRRRPVPLVDHEAYERCRSQNLAVITAGEVRRHG